MGADRSVALGDCAFFAVWSKRLLQKQMDGRTACVAQKRARRGRQMKSLRRIDSIVLIRTAQDAVREE